MEESSTEILDGPVEAADESDGLSVKRWLIVYVAYLLALAIPAAVMLNRTGVEFKEFLDRPAEVTAAAEPILKLLIFAIFISVACTFLPLPTGPIVAAVAVRQFAPYDNLWITTLLVASIGAIASVMANLHDFHLFTWMLRNHRIARVRANHVYQRAVRWFGRRPFTLLVIFNILPIPIDVIRMMAATYRYPLRPFAAANFIGRWVRYAVIAAVTFRLGDNGWIIAAALLTVAIIMAGIKIGGKLFARRSV